MIILRSNIFGMKNKYKKINRQNQLAISKISPDNYTNRPDRQTDKKNCKMRILVLATYRVGILNETQLIADLGIRFCKIQKHDPKYFL